MLLDECKHIDVIITTALIPGRKAPVLIKKHHVEAMPSGGVTIDLAAASGGNVETTVAGMRAYANFYNLVNECTVALCNQLVTLIVDFSHLIC